MRCKRREGKRKQKYRDRERERKEKAKEVFGREPARKGRVKRERRRPVEQRNAEGAADIPKRTKNNGEEERRTGETRKKNRGRG